MARTSKGLRLARRQKVRVVSKAKSDANEGWPNEATRRFHNWMEDSTKNGSKDAVYEWSEKAKTANQINKHRCYHVPQKNWGLDFFVSCIDDAIDHMHSMKHGSGVALLDRVVLDFLWDVDSAAIAEYWMDMDGDFSGEGF